MIYIKLTYGEYEVEQDMGKKFGLSWSWKRALGISGARQSFARKTGICTTKSGWERKIGRTLLNLFK